MVSGGVWKMDPGGVEAPSSFERVREVLADTVWSWLFPARCGGCGRFETFLCDDCRALLTPVGPEQCPRCGNPGVGWTSPAWCSVCVGQEVAFLRARSAFLYEGVARHLVTAFKFQGQRSLAPVMAELAGGAFADLVAPMSDPIVTWVPSHRATERARGYNQAEVLAHGLAKQAGGLPAIALARKVSRTQHQQTLSRQSRQANLQSVPSCGRRRRGSSRRRGGGDRRGRCLYDRRHRQRGGVGRGTGHGAPGLRVHLLSYGRRREPRCRLSGSGPRSASRSGGSQADPQGWLCYRWKLESPSVARMRRTSRRTSQGAETE